MRVHSYIIAVAVLVSILNIVNMLNGNMSFKNKKVVIIDYGMGNLGSLLNVLKYVGVKTEITDDPSIISKSPMFL